MLKATKIRLYPRAEQAAFLNRQFGAVRFAYNTGLRIISHRYKRHGQSLSAKGDIKKLLPVAKKSRQYGWLKEADSVALAQACLHLDQAFQRFFDPKQKAGYPRFKSKRGKQSSYHCMSVKVGEDWIKVAKLGPIKAKVHRPIDGKLKSITLSRTVTGKHYASLLYETEQVAPPPLMDVDVAKVVGLDMGLSHLAIDSAGRKIANPRFLKKAQKNLKRKQQGLSRKSKGSAKGAKARLRLAKAHERVAHARNDFQHKLSRQIVDDNQAVVVETLKVKNMMKNAKLAKHIGDASWHALTEKLEYKAKEQGKPLVKIEPWFPSSKTCPLCQHKMDSMALNERDWTCPSCGTHHDRDINAALNIKHQGILKLKAEGLSVSAHRGSRKSGMSPVAA
ncbi:transposase, IS605 OrfB family [Nitrosococcus halophilus Nc 4]|uniref:Transposase, IS605 OrfB family n=1 Tax=Nitrosococcus halophilus (strain Nc4) TaxID=472759 RepID=D5BZP8_NITHN|nr:RNA-guided endonuclease TnpB family protein [Nitrosococcus halophilus]ADE14343.1 transposase, IS605 OrfB family [Nitrosococcus halophilus Nc 4]